MAVLPILTQEAPILRQKAKRVARVDDSVRKLIDDMVDTMVAAPGVGLAAPQVGVGLRVLVIKTDENLHALVNPEMVKGEGEQIGPEGCLSVPGYVGEVKRFLRVVARGLNRHGKTVKVKGDGLLARAIQHEIDHLDGILFTDRLTSLDTLRKVEPEEQEQKAELVGV
ncbi:MAG: peptide deformylase [Chloroflexi bacterium]|nr:MAG: peptide deformylase [Chloroflexota bacterium]TMG34617.1 MAG: peptide deformylase [Chloroflexota bacterium]